MVALPSAWQDLTAGRRDVLIVLAADQPMSGAEIQRELDKDHRAVVNQHLAELEDLGYVERDPGSGHFGGVENALTDEGRQLLIDVLPTYHRAQIAIAP